MPLSIIRCLDHMIRLSCHSAGLTEVYNKPNMERCQQFMLRCMQEARTSSEFELPYAGNFQVTRRPDRTLIAAENDFPPLKCRLQTCM
jgi:hypothetical protein